MKQRDASDRELSGAAAAHGVRCGVLMFALFCLAGCSNQTSSITGSSSNLPQSYVGLSANGSNLALDTFTIDHGAMTFAQQAYAGNDGFEQYVLTSGTFTALTDGILDIGVTFANGTLDATGSGGTLYNPPQTGNWTLELPGQGGFSGLLGQQVSPFASNQICPFSATPQTFQFVTFPNAGDSTGTAYGRATIGGTGGGGVNFSNITQFNISGGAPVNPPSASTTGNCGPTVYGQTISVPNTTTVTGSSQSQTPSAMIAIAPGGFLVEGNGYTTQTSPPTYQNILGAGFGAVGLVQPSTPLSTSALVGAQYVAYFYPTGAVTKSNATIVAPASLIGSFGYPSLQTACPSLPAPQTGSILYGGQFSKNDPSSSAYGNCDFAIDLGAQDAKNNGLFPNATVWVGAAFPRTPSSAGYRNQTSTAYSFSAVGIAGQVQGKFAIFVIGLDATGLQSVVTGATQDWGVYLLQSN